MTKTIQDRIEKINFEYKKKFPNTMMLVVSENEQHHKDIEIEKEVLEFWNNKLIQSIKEVEEETRKEILDYVEKHSNNLVPIIGNMRHNEATLRLQNIKLQSITNKEK